MIIEVTPSHVRLQFGDKTVTVEGEGYARGYGSPDFVVYKNSIQEWDPPYKGEKIDDYTRDYILTQLKAGMEERGIVIEIE